MTETVVGAGRRICVGSEAGLEALTHGFNRGFSDYEYGRKFTPNEMRFFLQRSGTELEDCAVLVVEDRGGWTGAGVALLAVEGSEAWCGGLAVDPDTAATVQDER